MSNTPSFAGPDATLAHPASVQAKPRQAARLHQLLSLLEAKSFWSITELAERFDVSEETVRRDVRQLEKDGKVQKTHGGVSVPSSVIEAPYRIRLREQAEAKQRIAQTAAALVSEGMTLLLDSGTTCLWLARSLAPIRNLTIVTNSVEVAHEVLGHAGQRLILAGGQIDPAYHAAFGAEPIALCRRFAPDLTVMSMGAIDATRGFLDFDANEADFKQALLEHSRRVMVLADQTKFGKSGFIQVAAFDQVHDLITDAPPAAPILAAAQTAGLRVHVAR